MKFLQLKSVQWLFAGALALLFYLISTGGPGNDQQVESACSEPVTFRVGEIDNRYHITENELADLMQEVAEVWSAAVNTTILAYDKAGDITLNLVYAEEQQISDRERQFRNRLEDEEFNITVLENEYKRMNRQYENEVRQYEKDSQNLQQTIEELNKWVIQKNEQGGFNEQELERFEEKKREIDLYKRNLSRREDELKQQAGELNSRISFLNKKIENKNDLVDNYNEMFAGVRKFTQGEYEWTSEGRTINVFHYLDRDELKLVIAHEVGHAFGIEHVSNSRSVMHHLMGSQSRPDIELTEEDVQALQKACKSQIN